MVKLASDEWDLVTKALQEEKAHMKGELFRLMNHKEDPRLDYWTSTTIKIISEKQYRWTKPPMSSLKTPTTTKTLDKIKLHNTPLLVPTEDEDWDMPTGLSFCRSSFFFLLMCCSVCSSVSHVNHQKVGR